MQMLRDIRTEIYSLALLTGAIEVDVSIRNTKWVTRLIA